VLFDWIWTFGWGLYLVLARPHLITSLRSVSEAGDVHQYGLSVLLHEGSEAEELKHSCKRTVGILA
jgi:hypothetical protein